MNLTGILPQIILKLKNEQQCQRTIYNRFKCKLEAHYLRKPFKLDPAELDLSLLNINFD